MAGTSPLPIAPPQYNQSHQSLLRERIEKNTKILDERLTKTTNKTSKESSLPLRRFQFLLMGA
jgi:hypothetical protein